MTQLHFTIGRKPESDRWTLRINGTEAFLSEADFEALPLRLRRALLRAERADETAYTKRLAPRVADSALAEAVDDFRERKGFWNLPTRPANGVQAPKPKADRLQISLADLGLGD